MEAKYPFVAEISLLAHKQLQFCVLQKNEIILSLVFSKALSFCNVV